MPAEWLCSPGMSRSVTSILPRPPCCPCVWVPGTGLIFPMRTLMLSQTSGQNRALAGLVGTVQVALCSPLSVRPPCMPSPASALPHGDSQSQMLGAGVAAALTEDFSRGRELGRQG